MIRNTILEPLLWWVFSAVAVTGVFAAIYMAVQQEYRQTLNDPQIQLAEDAAARLAAGDVPASVVPRSASGGGSLVDLDKSLAPWIAVYDSQGTPLESSGQLDGAPPQPPKGLFNSPTTRVTWQPREGVRQALIIIQAKNGMFVVTGRNMRVQEERVAQLGQNLLIAWSFTLGCLFIASLVLWGLLKR